MTLDYSRSIGEVHYRGALGPRVECRHPYDCSGRAISRTIAGIGPLVKSLEDCRARGIVLKKIGDWRTHSHSYEGG